MVGHHLQWSKVFFDTVKGKFVQAHNIFVIDINLFFSNSLIVQFCRNTFVFYAMY